MSPSSPLYRTIWRWHFYAGLLVIPFVLILSLSGAVYLFKPQIDRWEERDFQGLPMADTVSPDQQREAALAAFPGATFHSYRLPERDSDAAMIHLALPEKQMRDVFVSPQGKVLGSIDPESRWIALDRKVHGQLLLGKRGSILVELAASWAIVMVLTGLYLWWPQGRGLAGVVWPRLSQTGRAFWRDLHAVAGFWVSGLALLLLLTGLPWTSVWGEAFSKVRSEMGWVQGPREWTLGGKAAVADQHADHDHAAMIAAIKGAADPMAGHDHSAHGMSPVRLSEVVAKAKGEKLAFPVMILPPGIKARGSVSTSWTARSEAANRVAAQTIKYDAMNGAVLSREGFADKHPLDRALLLGIAWHEGALFGWVNQLIGVLTALLLATLSVSGFVMWRKRKPEGRLGAPPEPAVPARIRGVALLILVLAVFLPLLGASLILVWLVERVILGRIPAAANWLGLSQPA